MKDLNNTKRKKNEYDTDISEAIESILNNSEEEKPKEKNLKEEEKMNTIILYGIKQYLENNPKVLKMSIEKMIKEENSIIKSTIKSLVKELLYESLGEIIKK